MVKTRGFDLTKGRTGRAGRKGQAITLFTEKDSENLRAIANVMRRSGCEVPKYMLELNKKYPKFLSAFDSETNIYCLQE